VSIVIRKATIDDCPGIAKVHVDSWRTTYNHIVPAEYLRSLSYSKSEQRWVERFKNANENYMMYVYVNEDGSIVGFADGGPIRDSNKEFKSELYAIYILKDYQRKGIGRQLFRSVVNHLSLQYNSMLVWVLADNESRYFYEDLGGKIIGTNMITIGDKELDEIAYCWSDVQDLKFKIM
jgi:L-amino acid N-acyltransferase YncA